MTVTVVPWRGIAGPDLEPVVVRSVRSWAAGPPWPPVPGRPAPVHHPSPTGERLRAAADEALARYPGPVGELLQRELLAFTEIGARFAGPTLIGRLVEDLLDHTGPDPGEEPTPA